MMRWAATVLLAFIVIACPISSQNQTYPSVYQSHLKTGPFVDSIYFRDYRHRSGLLDDLQSGVLEMSIHDLWASELQDLEANPSIAISSIKRNYFGHLTINCAKYPLSISSLRRAFAFAFNKSAPFAEHSNLPDFSFVHDSLVSPANPYCIEEELPFHYYDAQPDVGNAILDELGFSVDNVTGFRKTPNGTCFQIEIIYPASQAINPVPKIAAQAFDALHIDAVVIGFEPTDLFLKLDNHDDYDVAYYATRFQNDDVRWLAYEYWSEYADVPGQNPCNFQNATFDQWRHQLLHGATYEDVYQAAAEMQKILHYNVPRLIVHGNYLKQAYRIDKYCGHIEDIIMSISGEWTLRRLQMIDRPMEGGTVSIGIHEYYPPAVNIPTSFNLFVCTGADSSIITKCLYSSLYDRGPDLKPINDLAENMVIETHSENFDIPEGSTRFVIDIVHNATWSDGVPLTAEDVAFTFNLLLELDDDIGFDSPYLAGVYSPSIFRVVIEYSDESYWLFSDFAYIPIVPKHIFTGFDVEDLANWNPIYDPSHPLVTSGPFILSEYIPNEYFRLSCNSRFYYGVNRSNITTTQSTTTTTINPSDVILPALLVAVPAVAVIILFRSRFSRRAV